MSQIEAESRRGDVSGALAAFAKLPEPARQAASGWAAEAAAKQAAGEALSSIREAAIAKLAAAESLERAGRGVRPGPARSFGKAVRICFGC